MNYITKEKRNKLVCATQWNGETLENLDSRNIWLFKLINKGIITFEDSYLNINFIHSNRLKTPIVVNKGDYIIYNNDSEVYSLSEIQFKNTYRELLQKEENEIFF